MTSEVSKPQSPMREQLPSVLHERGRIAPPLPKGTPLVRRVARAVVRLGQGLYFHDGFRVAPAMAFHFFLSLLPLLVFVGWVVGALVRSEGADSILAPYLALLPASTGSVVEREAHRLAGADRLGPLAAIGFLSIASSGAHGLMDAVEGVVGVPRRPWWKKRVMAVAWVIASLVAIAVASFGVVQWEEVFSEKEDPSATVVMVERAPSAGGTVDKTTLRRHGGASRGPRVLRMFRSEGERLLALSFSLAGAIAGLAAFYRLSVSHVRRVKRRVFPGAVLAVGLWLAISWVFGLYVKTLSDYAVFYGSLAAVAVLLMWLWLASLAILVGAELNSQLEGLRDLAE